MRDCQQYPSPLSVIYYSFLCCGQLVFAGNTDSHRSIIAKLLEWHPVVGAFVTETLSAIPAVMDPPVDGEILLTLEAVEGQVVGNPEGWLPGAVLPHRGL